MYKVIYLPTVLILLQSCAFTKEYDGTALYVSMSSNMRVAYTDGACCRWYFKFNGNECSDPAKIEAVTYGAGYGVSYNLHRPRILIGRSHFAQRLDWVYFTIQISKFKMQSSCQNGAISDQI